MIAKIPSTTDITVSIAHENIRLTAGSDGYHFSIQCQDWPAKDEGAHKRQAKLMLLIMEKLEEKGVLHCSNQEGKIEVNPDSSHRTELLEKCVTFVLAKEALETLCRDVPNLTAWSKLHVGPLPSSWLNR